MDKITAALNTQIPYTGLSVKQTLVIGAIALAAVAAVKAFGPKAIAAKV